MDPCCSKHCCSRVNCTINRCQESRQYCDDGYNDTTSSSQCIHFYSSTLINVHSPFLFFKGQKNECTKKWMNTYSISKLLSTSYESKNPTWFFLIGSFPLMDTLPFFLFFLIYIYFNWRLITLQYCSGFAIYQHESTMGVHVFPILNPPPTSLPPYTIPLGHPSALAPSTLSHATNLDWWFVSHMIIYMFQCDSPKSSHPRPLPQSPKDCSIHLCLFSVSHIGSSLPSF